MLVVMWGVMGEWVVVVVVPFSRAKNRQAQVGSLTHHYLLLLQFFQFKDRKGRVESIDLLH